MSDLISREDAIDVLGNTRAIGISAYDALASAMKGIKALPSAEKVGHWIERNDGFGDTYYECSVCKEAFALLEGTPMDNLYCFCPNCGADMRGDNDE